MLRLTGFRGCLSADFPLAKGAFDMKRRALFYREGRAAVLKQVEFGLPIVDLLGGLELTRHPAFLPSE
jgi:hypothetical protein